MSAYQLAPACIRDLNEIIVYTAEHRGPDAALDLQEALLAACARLAQMHGLGHRRSDLTTRPFFFYAVDPFLIVYARGTNPLGVLAILHASRDIRRLLRTRSI